MIITIIALINVERENHKGHIHLPFCIHNFLKNYEDNVNHPYFTIPMVSRTNSHYLWILTTLAPEMKCSIHFNWRTFINRLFRTNSLFHTCNWNSQTRYMYIMMRMLWAPKKYSKTYISTTWISLDNHLKWAVSNYFLNVCQHACFLLVV